MTLFLLLSMLSSSVICANMVTAVPDLLERQVTKTTEEKLAGDKFSTAYILWVPKTLKSHSHAEHNEFLFIIEGGGVVQHSNTSFSADVGDLVFIPKGVKHAIQVAAKRPLIAMSFRGSNLESPKGKDATLTKISLLTNLSKLK